MSQANTTPIKTFNAIDDLIDNAYANGIIHGVFAESQSGKTIMLLQQACKISSKTGKPALYVDTEGGGHNFVKTWMPKFEKMYKDCKVDVFETKRWKQILKDHGKNTSIGNTADSRKTEAGKDSMKSTKMTIHLLEDYTDDYDRNKILMTCYDKQAKNKCKYCAIVYDSVTHPLKYFATNTQNFPARANFIEWWYDTMQFLSDEFKGLVIFTINHESKNPQNQYDKPIMTGGNTVQYNSKVQFRINKLDGKLTKNVRVVILKRYFDKAPDIHKNYCRLTDDGFVDLTKEEIDAIHKAAAKRKD